MRLRTWRRLHAVSAFLLMIARLLRVGVALTSRSQRRIVAARRCQLI
jgi:hypothetical protein